MSELNTCPECGLFVWACKCKFPIETRGPTEKEIRKYTDFEEIGLRVNDAFVLGFKSGWIAHKDHLKDFLAAQTITQKNTKEVQK